MDRGLCLLQNEGTGKGMQPASPNRQHTLPSFLPEDGGGMRVSMERVCFDRIQLLQCKKCVSFRRQSCVNRPPFDLHSGKRMCLFFQQ